MLHMASLQEMPPDLPTPSCRPHSPSHGTIPPITSLYLPPTLRLRNSLGSPGIDGLPQAIAHLAGGPHVMEVPLPPQVCWVENHPGNSTVTDGPSVRGLVT